MTDTETVASSVKSTVKMIARREPAIVMRLERLGSFHQSRLSFMRILTRTMQREKWTFSRPVFQIDEKGVGHAVYCAHGPERVYSLVAFAHDLPDEQRSDRVIATAWDSTFTLFDGVPTDEDIQRLSKNVPRQEAGRITQTELSLSRANRSVRLWEHVVSCLAQGRQPDTAQIADVGYLMRTTAVYGSGKFGAADRQTIDSRPEFAAPFQVEMLSVFLTRCYSRDLVQHMASVRGGAKTATLAPDIARSIGIGNSTGLGMAPFILNHPELFNNWIMAREEAIARVRNVQDATLAEITLFRQLVKRSIVSVQRWHTKHAKQIEKLAALRADLQRLDAKAASTGPALQYPWDEMYRWAETSLSIEGQECLASLMLEPYAEVVDGLTAGMSFGSGATMRVNGSMPLSQLRVHLETDYAWALDIDWSERQTHSRAWYVSAEKLEPRLGERFDEPIEEYEQALAPGRDAARLYNELQAWPESTRVSEFLLRHPEHRHSVRRVQVLAQAPYAEIRDNTISHDVLPIDMLRCKLSFFGATHFDPRSDRWVRICLYANAPYPEELGSSDADYWPYPVSDNRMEGLH